MSKILEKKKIWWRQIFFPIDLALFSIKWLVCFHGTFSISHSFRDFGIPAIYIILHPTTIIIEILLKGHQFLLISKSCFNDSFFLFFNQLYHNWQHQKVSQFETSLCSLHCFSFRAILNTGLSVVFACFHNHLNE